VVERASNRCEYCQLAQHGQAATFHIDHIVPESAGGETAAENLALACVGCSLHKSARQTAVDPESGESVSLFHPRQQPWREHFEWHGELLVARTAIGRATINALRMNRPIMLEIRRESMILGRHPYVPL
jgi:hypothetical protein